MNVVSKIKGKEAIQHIITFCVLMVLVGACYFVMRTKFNEIRDKQTRDNGYYSSIEFLPTIDCAPTIDKYGMDKEYVLTFELKSDTPGTVQVYFQNGSDSKYSFSNEVQATTKFQKYSFIVKPAEQNLDVQEAYLSFYGGYGSGIKPTVRYIDFEVSNQ